MFGLLPICLKGRQGPRNQSLLCRIRLLAVKRNIAAIAPLLPNDAAPKGFSSDMNLYKEFFFTGNVLSHTNSLL